MSVYTQNFDGVTTPAIPSSWLNVVGSTFQTRTQLNGITITPTSGLQFAAFGDATWVGSNGNAATYTGAGNLANGTAKVNFRSSGTTQPHLLMCCDGTGTQYYDLVGPLAGANTLTIKRRSGGVSATVATGAGSITTVGGTWYTLELDVQSGVVRGRVYAVGGSPSVWDLTYTDGSPLAAGNPGLLGEISSASASAFDDFAYTYTVTTVSVSPDSVLTSSTGGSLTLTGAGGADRLAWTAGTPGSPTFTASAGTITAQTVASGTSATLTYSAPVSAQTVTLTDPRNSVTGPLTIATGAATSYTLAGPPGSLVSVASTNFTVTPNGIYTGTITPASTGAGTFSPTSLAYSSSAAPKTFTYTPSSTTGSPHTISTTSSPALTNPTSISYAVASVALTAGAITLTSVGDTITTMTASVATNGTPTYTYQWYRSTVSAFVPGASNLVAGATSTTLNDTGLVNGVTYHYKVIVTDSAAATATYLQVAASPAKPVSIILIGDSWLLTADGALSAFAAGWKLVGALNALGKSAFAFTTSNQGVGGTSTTDWQPGGGNYVAALSGRAAASWPYVFIQLGINDSNPSIGNNDPPTYQTKLQAIVTALVAAGYKVILAAPPYIKPFSANHTDTGALWLSQYATNQVAIASANSANVYAIGADMYQFIADHYSDIGGDNVHPTVAQGAADAAAIWAKGIFNTVFSPPPAPAYIIGG